MKDPLVYLNHIVESIEKIQGYVLGMSREEYLSDDKTQDAVIRQFEIIGEAVRYIPKEFLRLHPTLPWEKMVAMRNKLIHEYFGVDQEVVWQTIHSRLPELKMNVNSVISQLDTQ